MIYAYLGPTYDNQSLKPFDFGTIDATYAQFHQGLPNVWKFDPIYFGKADFR
jgi:hypothetical protein